MSVHTVTEASLGSLLSVGASGGQGEVFRTDVTLDTSAGVVPALYKRYHRRDATSTPDTAALRRQVEFLTELSAKEGRWLTARAAWPLVLVDDAGFLMAEAPSRFRANLADAGGMQAHLAKAQLLLNSEAYLSRHSLRVSDRWRMEFLADVAESLHWLHTHDVTVADFSCNNLLFALNGKPRSFLIDCDSAALRSASVLPLADTPEWECPHEAPGSVAVDVYKFGLLAARLFAGSQTTRTVPAGRLPEAVARLAEASLGQSAGSRPHMSEWRDGLRAAAPGASDASPPSRRPTPAPTPAPARATPVAGPAAAAPAAPRLAASPIPFRLPAAATPSTPARPTSTPPTPPRSRHHPGAWLAAAAAAVLLVVWLAQSSPTEAGYVEVPEQPSQPSPEPEVASVPAVYGPYPTMNDARLWIRSGPTTADEIVGEIAARSEIVIVCRASGEAIEGPYGTTTGWDWIEEPAAGFVSDAWVDTTTDDAIPAC